MSSFASPDPGAGTDPAAEPAPSRPSDGGVEAYQGALADIAADLDAIDAALGRLDRHEFDSCRVCGGRIGRDRLLADPLLTTCSQHTPS